MRRLLTHQPPWLAYLVMAAILGFALWAGLRWHQDALDRADAEAVTRAQAIIKVTNHQCHTSKENRTVLREVIVDAFSSSTNPQTLALRDRLLADAPLVECNEHLTLHDVSKGRAR